MAVCVRPFDGVLRMKRNARAKCSAALLFGVLAIAAAPAPRRIVSINPCVDAVLYEVTPSASIAAISHYSQDPAATSVPLAWARAHHAIYGTAEEVIALHPDLVIASPYTELAARTAMARTHLRVILIGIPQSVAESEAQVRSIANVVGQPAAGARLAERIAAALAAAAPPAGAPPVPAIIYQAGGLVPGAGTLPDELLRRTGFANLSHAYGLQRWDVMTAEQILARPPAVIFTPLADQSAEDGSFEGASRTLKARAFARLRGRTLVANFPERLLFCAGPNLIAAAERLAATRRRLRPHA